MKAEEEKYPSKTSYSKSPDNGENEATMKEEERNHGLDLPLSANYNELFVHHYIFDLECDVMSHVFRGMATFFVKGRESNEIIQSKISKPCFVLDSFAIEVIDCWSYDLSESDELILKSAFSAEAESLLKSGHHHMQSYVELYRKYQKGSQCRRLPFVVENHSIRIEMPHLESWSHIETIISIQYKTRPEGPSLMWTFDQEKRPCVFTIGDSLNNRSLFPCQDMPKAMSTWHCTITLPAETPSEMMVLMTGEDEHIISHTEKNERTFEYFSSLKMPMSTFALAIGCWSFSELNFPCLFQDPQESLETNISKKKLHHPKCRLFTPPSMKENSTDLFIRYLPTCFDALAEVLEPFPLNRLDFLIVPECFDSLGLASPHLVFISQSLLCEDHSMFHRLSHELCHTWFGILTGPCDWTEEWVTEGICCYLEDIIHAKALGWTDEEESQKNGLRIFQKYELLTAEIENTPDHLQLLRPEKGITKSDEEEKFVKNGMDTEKSFMQIHYLKGFFLLKFLENLAGKRSLLNALKEFITQRHGCLFSSQELLDYFFTHCDKLKESCVTVNEVCQEWLDCSGLPQMLSTCPSDLSQNSLYQEVMDEFQYRGKLCSRCAHCLCSREMILSGYQSLMATSVRRKRDRKKRASAKSTLAAVVKNRQLIPEQIVLLIGKFLENGSDLHLTSSFIESFRNSFIKDTQNAEILHCWCELIIQQKASKWFADVETFLHRHRAMGLYLYGEMMISENACLQSLAVKCYRQHRASMPRAALKELEEMLNVGEEKY